jgi:hypothetical protein
MVERSGTYHVVSARHVIDRAHDSETPIRWYFSNHDERKRRQDADAASFDYWASNGDEVQFRL